jgi:hypothetical protein
VDAYREILGIDRDNIPAMNNLAVLLTAKPESLPDPAKLSAIEKEWFAAFQ